MKVCFFISLFSFLQVWAELPIWPSTPDHPSSLNYQYSFAKESFTIEKREVVVFRPIAFGNSTNKNFPVIVYGHGQALGLAAYERTFSHLAQKGIAVVFPRYDKGFFDQDWRRMGRDYLNLTSEALKRYSTFDPNEVVFSGHSKGAFVALMAAATPRSLLEVKSLLLFSPAGFEEEYLKAMDPSIKLTAVWAQGDNVIKKELVESIVELSPARFKQLIEVGSYANFSPGHFYTLHKANLFGGRNGVHAFHFYGVWPWAFGAAKKEGSDYLYGDFARDMGVSNNTHSIKRYGTL